MVPLGLDIKDQLGSGVWSCYQCTNTTNKWDELINTFIDAVNVEVTKIRSDKDIILQTWTPVPVEFIKMS